MGYINCIKCIIASSYGQVAAGPVPLASYERVWPSPAWQPNSPCGSIIWFIYYVIVTCKIEGFRGIVIRNRLNRYGDVAWGGPPSQSR